MDDSSQVTGRTARAATFVAVGAAFMGSLDLFVVNVAFDDIGRDFGVGAPGGPAPSTLSWVLTAYAVAFAAFLVPLGRYADRYGRRRMFVAGLLVFTAASLACAASPGVGWLVASRAVQAIGAAAMTPASLGLLTATLPPARRPAAVRLWTAAGTVAAAVGPTVGGLLVTASWRWVFLMNLPVGVALVVGAVVVFRELPTEPHAARPDLPGAVAAAVAVGGFALALTNGHSWGWTGAATVATLLVAVAAGVVLVLRSSRHPAPVVPPELVRLRPFRLTNLAMLCFSAAFGVLLLVVVLWMQQVWGYSSLVAGVGLALGPLVAVVVTLGAPTVVPGWSAARRTVVGCVLGAVGAAALAWSLGPSPTYLRVVPGWLLVGTAVGLALPNLFGAATQALPARLAATGSGVINMARQVGYVVGVSGLYVFVGDAQGPAAQTGTTHALWACGAAMLLAAAVAARASGGVTPELPAAGATSPAAGGPATGAVL